MKSDAGRAARLFSDGARSYPSAPIFRFSELIALVRAKRLAEATRVWEDLEPTSQRDIRYGGLAAMIGLATGDLSAADRWLAGQGEEVEPAVLDLRYFVLLWKREYRRAAELAQQTASRDTSDAARWLERSGDALLLAGAPGEARSLYEQVLEREPDDWGATTRLADVFFLLGDAAREKTVRERIYGHLGEQ
jgi:tetratricopeptide (TPR) repeat protein